MGEPKVQKVRVVIEATVTLYEGETVGFGHLIEAKSDGHFEIKSIEEIEGGE